MCCNVASLPSLCSQLEQDLLGQSAKGLGSALHGGGREQARANPVLRPEPCAHLPERAAKQKVGAPKLNLCETLPIDDEQKHLTLLEATEPSAQLSLQQSLRLGSFAISLQAPLPALTCLCASLDKEFMHSISGL